MFNDFIKCFLELKGYFVKISSDSVEGIRIAINFLPDLIILNKEFLSLDAMGFVIKKRTLHAIADRPMFLIGDFSPDELYEFKKENVQAFLSSPLNPTALLERLNIFFDRKIIGDYSKTPMLMDMHVKCNIIIIQIEGNFEAVQLELMNYLIRNYCIQKKIQTPKVFLIIPSLYNESITKDNIKRLFKFMTYHEIKMDYRCVKILSSVQQLIKNLKAHAEYQNFEFVGNYADGIQSLQVDFDKQKSIPADFLKPGSSFIFDLYDEQGRKLIPAMTKLSEAVIRTIKSRNITRLTYYSDKDIDQFLNPGHKEEADKEEVADLLEEELLLDLMELEYEPIESELKALRILDQKQSLFFRNMKGQDALIISCDEDYTRVIINSMDIYFKIEFIQTGTGIREMLRQKRYVLIFIDAELIKPDALELLQIIRSEATRRKTSVIILTRKIDKVSVIRYRDCGTNNILLSPFSTSKLQQTVFDAITSDRRT